MKNDTTFARMSNGDHLGDGKMSKKDISCLASNPGPYHFDLLDLREEGLGKLLAILEIVRSTDRFDPRFHRFSL